jgi:hypothetical protein
MKHSSSAAVLPFRDPPDACLIAHTALNLGPKSSAWLQAIGITTLVQIRKLGPIEACRRPCRAGYPVSVLMAYALDGAMNGIHWNHIPFGSKQWLKTEFARMKREESSKSRD